MFIQLVGVGNTGHVEGFCRADQRPERGAIGLGDNVGGDAVASSVPSGRDLTGHQAAEADGLGDQDARALLELDEPLVALAGPDIALVAVLVPEFLRVRLGCFERFEIMEKLDFLVEDLLLRVIAVEELGLYQCP